MLNKHVNLRVRSWLQCLSRPLSNVTWKRCRNQYADLLMFQLTKGRLDEPFDRQPPGGPLPNLPKHALVAMRAARRPKDAPKRAQSAEPSYLSRPNRSWCALIFKSFIPRALAGSAAAARLQCKLLIPERHSQGGKVPTVRRH
jgi:Domain of unknown function (DUF4485)